MATPQDTNPTSPSPSPTFLSIPATPGIYRIRHIPSGKAYYGSAINLRARWRVHHSDLSRGKHHSRHLQNAWNKYGLDQFIFEVVEEVSQEKLLEREQHNISIYMTYEKSRGYNISPTAGSPLGTKHSDQTREKMSRAKKELASTPEGYAHLVKISRDRLENPEAISNMSKAAIKRYKDPDENARHAEHNRRIASDPIIKAKKIEAWKKTMSDPAIRAKLAESRRGKPLSPEHRAKIAEAGKGRKHSPETRAKMAETRRRFWADLDLENRKRLIEGNNNGNQKRAEAMRRIMADPDVREKRMEAMRKSHKIKPSPDQNTFSFMDQEPEP